MKRRFEFRLERVRRVRDLEERVARSERAQAEALARAAEASRDQARSVLEESRARLRTILSGHLAPRDVLAYQRALDAELASLRRRVESARTLRTQAERMAAVHKERTGAARALEELRGRAAERHRGALEAHENALLDEVAQRRTAGSRTAGPRDVAAREGASSSGHPPADQDSGALPRDP